MGGLDPAMEPTHDLQATALEEHTERSTEPDATATAKEVGIHDFWEFAAVVRERHLIDFVMSLPVWLGPPPFRSAPRVAQLLPIRNHIYPSEQLAWKGFVLSFLSTKAAFAVVREWD